MLQYVPITSQNCYGAPAVRLYLKSPGRGAHAGLRHGPWHLETQTAPGKEPGLTMCWTLTWHSLGFNTGFWRLFLDIFFYFLWPGLMANFYLPVAWPGFRRPGFSVRLEPRRERKSRVWSYQVKNHSKGQKDVENLQYTEVKAQSSPRKCIEFTNWKTTQKSR